MTDTEDSCSKPGARYQLGGAVNELCPELRRGHTEDTGKRPAVFYTYIIGRDAYSIVSKNLDVKA